VALVVVPTPIVSVLFERGAYTAADTPATAGALAIFALGLPSFVLIKVFSPAFFAREDTKTPMRYAAISLIANTLGSVALFFYFRQLGVMPHLGIAVATSLGGWLNAVLLWAALARHGHFEADHRLKRSLPLILLSSLGMGVALLVAAAYLAPWFEQTNGLFVRAGALAALVAIGVVSYFAIAHATGAARLDSLAAAIRRRS
jgi:putative peptidoglycan lipid II flippase